MAFHMVMFEKYGGFRTDLGPGPNPEVPRPNEDAEFGRRLMAAGERIRYEPSAVVYHPILENRVRKNYFLVWWFDYGRADVREWRRQPDIGGIPRAYLTIVKAGITRTIPEMWRWVFAVNPVRRFYGKCQVCKTMGWIVELYRSSASPAGRNCEAVRLGRGAGPNNRMS